MSITLNAPSSAIVGVPFVVSGTVEPPTDFVFVGLSRSSTVPPLKWYPIGGNSEEWSLTFTPNFNGIVYAWAQQQSLIGDSAGVIASLRWSDTRGRSWLQPLQQSLGAKGAFYTNVQWRRLGQGRDRVFELSWTMDALTGLNGAFVDTELAES